MGVLAFKSGIWIFDVRAPGQLPDAVALPFNLVAPRAPGSIGHAVWHPCSAQTAARDVGQILSDAADAARAQRPDRVTPLLSRLADSQTPPCSPAAASACHARSDVARPLFRRAWIEIGSFRATLGMDPPP